MKNGYTIEGGVVTVRLTQNQVMLVSEDTLPLLASYRWYAHRNRNTFYAATHIRLPDGRRTVLMAHRLIMALKPGDPREVDHLSGSGLDNLPSNLRVVDSAGNSHNLHGKQRWCDGSAPTSSLPGVCWHKGKAKWRTQIGLNGLPIYLGYWDAEDEENAAAAYRVAKTVRDAGGTANEIRAAVRRKVVGMRQDKEKKCSSSRRSPIGTPG